MNELQEALNSLQQELDEGDITVKGFEKKKKKLLEKFHYLTEVFDFNLHKISRIRAKMPSQKSLKMESCIIELEVTKDLKIRQYLLASLLITRMEDI